MNKAIENIEKELKAARDRSSTNNSYDYAYANGLEYALKQVKNLTIPVVVGRSELFKCPTCCDTKVKANGDYCADCEEPLEGI